MMVALYLRPLLNEGGLAQLVERLHGMQDNYALKYAARLTFRNLFIM